MTRTGRAGGLTGHAWDTGAGPAAFQQLYSVVGGQDVLSGPLAPQCGRSCGVCEHKEPCHIQGHLSVFQNKSGGQHSAPHSDQALERRVVRVVGTSSHRARR